MQPTSAYIHVPFCQHRCGYCNFTVVARRDDLVGDFLAALERELSWLAAPRPVKTLFIGGGTPTYLAEPQLVQLLDIVTRWFPPSAGNGWDEFSVEANPADLSTHKQDLLVERGVSRLSIGAQSFNADKLKLLERDHCSADIVCAVEAAHQRFHSVSLDLIFGVPNESVVDWQQDLIQAAQLPIQHVSTYGLTFERGTSFWSRRNRGELQGLADSVEADMYLAAIDFLADHGWTQYEVSNFARPDFCCRHNMVYWRGEPYYAAGPGAARYVNGCRETNHRSTTTYLKRVLADQSPVAEAETLSSAATACERLVLGLRMLAGIDETDFEHQTGYAVMDLAGEEIETCVDRGLLQRRDGRLCLTRAGLLVSDSIWPELLTHVE